jgi:hypothetical protein
MIYEYEEPRWNDTDRDTEELFWEKPVPVPLCPPQIPRGLTRASAVRGRRITTWAMARTHDIFLLGTRDSQ